MPRVAAQARWEQCPACWCDGAVARTLVCTATRHGKGGDDVSELGTLIQEFRDRERGVISDAEIGRQVGVTRGAIGAWIRGLSAMPQPAHLRALARYIGVPYDRVLQAALADAGYYGPKELMGNAQHPAPIAAVVDPATATPPKRRRAAASQPPKRGPRGQAAG